MARLSGFGSRRLERRGTYVRRVVTRPARPAATQRCRSALRRGSPKGEPRHQEGGFPPALSRPPAWGRSEKRSRAHSKSRKHRLEALKILVASLLFQSAPLPTASSQATLRPGRARGRRGEPGYSVDSDWRWRFQDGMSYRSPFAVRLREGHGESLEDQGEAQGPTRCWRISKAAGGQVPKPQSKPRYIAPKAMR